MTTPLATAISRRGSQQFQQLVDKLLKVAKENFGLGRTVFGISIESPVAAVVARRTVEALILSQAKILAAAEAPKEHFITDQKLFNPNAGEVMVFDAKTSFVRRAKESEIREVDVVVSPGLGGGDSQERLYNTISEMLRVFPNRGLAIYSPINEGEHRACRYARGNACYAVPGFINEEESENFFRKVLLPRFFDSSGKPLPPEGCQRLLMANFSIGGREAESHFRFLGNKLLASGVKRRDISRYFERIAIFNIGCPRPSWESPEDRPLTATVFSKDDMGCRKLPQFVIDFLLNESLGLRPAEIISRTGFGGEPDNREMILLLRHGEITCGGPRGENAAFIPNILGHNLANYVDAIHGLGFGPEANKISEVRNVVELFDAFANREIANSEVEERRREVFSKSSTYEACPIESVSEESITRFFLSLEAYAQRESAAKANFLGFRSYFRSSPPSQSACAVQLPVMSNFDVADRGSALSNSGKVTAEQKKDQSNKRNFSILAVDKKPTQTELNAALEVDEIKLGIDGGPADEVREKPSPKTFGAIAEVLQPNNKRYSK